MKIAQIRRWSSAVAALGLMLVATSLPAFAHAALLETAPAHEASTKSPEELRLTFSESIELAFAEITISGDGDQQIELEKLSLAPNDNKTMIVTVANQLPTGTFTVDWSVVSLDGHKVEGSYSFEVVE